MFLVADDEEEEDGVDPDAYTNEEVSRMWHVLINANREKLTKKYQKFVTGGQGGMMCFNTHSGNMLIQRLGPELATIMNKPLPDRFDSLFALTYFINTYDDWLNDNEEYGESGMLRFVLSALLDNWKRVLAKTDKELGIDAEFTRPAASAMINSFVDTVTSLDHTSIDFEWD